MQLQPLDLSSYRKQPTPEASIEPDDASAIPARSGFPTDALPEPLQSMVRYWP